MGNHFSCTLNNSSATKLILPNREIKTLLHPQSITAAELMFETPNYFLVNSKSLTIGQRFFAINADQDLEIGNIYIMFPMKKFNSIVTSTDMNVLLLLAKKKVSGNGKSNKVIPEEQEPETKSRLNLLDEFVDEFQLRLSLCRSKKPLLETIKEEEPPPAAAAATVFSSR